MEDRKRAVRETIRTSMDNYSFLKWLSCEVRFNEQMKNHTSFKTGGDAELMVFPEEVSDIRVLIDNSRKRKIPIFIIGGGTNLIVRDGGIRGMVINMQRLNRVTMMDDTLLYVESGLSLPRLVRYCQKKGLSGMESATGIPGSVGGAIMMNAGIQGWEISSILDSIKIVDRYGLIRVIKRDGAGFTYRGSHIPAGIIIGGLFRLKKADISESESLIRERLAHRKERQPIRDHSAGCIFKNPSGYSAGRLIEEVGLKGYRIGDAEVSKRHANFIINKGSASSKDIISLIRYIGKRIEEEMGITLELEVKVVGREGR
ncbi:MAG: UDP-N-acetylmuramate dehydrogenase [Nitrospirota bacterium]